MNKWLSSQNKFVFIKKINKIKNTHTHARTNPRPNLFGAGTLFLGGPWDFGDESSSSSPSFADCIFGWGSSIRRLHIPAVGRLPLPYGLEVVLPALSRGSRRLSQVQSVKKLSSPTEHQWILQYVDSRTHNKTRRQLLNKTDICLTSLETSFGFDFDMADGREKKKIIL